MVELSIYQASIYVKPTIATIIT